MIIKTKNSTYEFEGGKFRKVTGEDRPAHPVQDDDWHTYHSFAFQPRVGRSCMIMLDERGDKYLSTSAVVEIEDDDTNFGWVSASDAEWN